MSITLIVGTPGAGKSYSAVHLSILPAIRSYRPVYTNVPLYVDAIRADLLQKHTTTELERKLLQELDIVVYDPEKLDTETLRELPGGILIVLDEIWRYWPSELKQLSAPDESFFAEHRHRTGRIPGVDGLLSQDIVLLTQDTSDVPRPIRSRVAGTFVVTKLTAVGSETRFRVDRYQGCVSSMRPPKSKLITTSMGHYSSDVWRYYQSHTKGSDTCGVDLSTVEAGAVKNRSVWSSPTMIMYYIIVVLGCSFLAYRFAFGPALFSPADASVPALSASSAADPLDSMPRASDYAIVPEVQGVADYLPPVPEGPTGLYAGYWITGSVQAGLARVVFLTNARGMHVTVRPASDACTHDGFGLRCLLDGDEIADVPLASRRRGVLEPQTLHSGFPLD